jgi:WD40 repeat protein
VLRVWEVATGKSLGTLGESFDYETMAFHPGNLGLARSVGAEIFVLDATTGHEIRRLRGHTEVVTAMGFSPDGRRLASAAHDGTVKLWDTATGREILTLLHGRDELLTGVSFSPNGLKIVSTSMSGTIKVWDAMPMPEPKDRGPAL